MENVCRLCGLVKSPKQLVSSIDDETLNVKQKLLACCHWETVGCDYANLPKKICNICIKILEKNWIFAEKVAQVQEHLISHVVEIKTEIFVSDDIDGNDEQFNEVQTNDDQSVDYSELNTYLPSDYEHYYPHQKEIDEYLQSLEEKVLLGHHKHNNALREKTPKLTEHLCEACGKHFSSQANLITHTHMHVPRNKRKHFQCYICKAVFSYKKSLLYHMPIHCGKKAKHQCNVCQLSFTRLDSLKRHTLIHLGSNPYECQMCGKAFRTKFHLTVIFVNIIQ